MSLCWNAPVRLGDFINPQGGAGLSLVGDDLGLPDFNTPMCRDGNADPQNMSFQFEHYGGGSMGNFLPSRCQLASAGSSHNGGDFGLVSEDAISDTSGHEFGMVPAELGPVSDQQTTVATARACDDDEPAHDMDINQFLELLNEPLQDNEGPCCSTQEGTRQTVGNYLESVPPPSLASCMPWELSLGGVSGTNIRGILLDSSACHVPARHVPMLSGLGYGNGSNVCQDLSISSQVSPTGGGMIDHSRSRQTDESVLVSDLEQVTTSSPSDYMNEPAASQSEDDCVFIYDSRPATSARSRRSSEEPSYINQCRIVDLTDADSSDGEVCDEREGAYMWEENGKRKLPGWLQPHMKRSRSMFPSPGANYSKPFGYPRLDAQPVDLLKVKAEAPAPQVWQSGNAVATLPTDLLNKQIAAAGQSVRHPTSRKLHDGLKFGSEGFKSLTDQIGRYDSGHRILPSSLLALPSGALAAQSGGLPSRTASASSVVSRGSGQGPTSEDEAASAILRGFLDGAHTEEVFLDEGLMTVPLLKHQRIALAWMVKREVVKRETANGDLPVGGILADDQGLGKTISMISLILKMRSPAQKPSSETALLPQPEHTTVHLEDEEDVKYLPSRQAVKSEVQVKVEGVSVKPKAQGGCPLSKTRASGGTLVVCPTSVLRQWANELRAKVSSGAGLTFVVYHGSSRIRDPEELAKFDVVLTTYCILSMEVPLQPSAEEQEEEKRNLAEYGLSHFSQPKAPKKSDKGKKKSKRGGEGQGGAASLPPAGPLARVAWFRVILDEAQSIKNGKTQVARAAWGLRAKRRWCLSGTPIQNSIDDLYSYFRFLRYAPYDKFNNFRAEIKDPIARNPPQGYLKLQTILREVLLRRTKTTRIDGQPIVNLPPRLVQLQQAEFNVDERAFYTCLENESRRQFQVYAAAGTVQSNYVNILWMLLRLRQACDHRQLVKGLSSHTPQQSAIDAVRKLPEEEQRRLLALVEANVSICSICNDALEEAVVTSCAHVFCEQCISQHLGTGDDATCPFPKCRKALRSSQLYPLAALSGQVTRVKDEPLGLDVSLLPPSFEPPQCWVSSSKIDAVISTLLALPPLPADRVVSKPEPLYHGNTGSDVVSPSNDGVDEETSVKGKEVQATEKAIVFSQWTSMLDLLEIPLRQAGFCYRRLDGTMTVNARDRAVHEFNTFPEVNVIIMSLKAASLGLNMVSASHVLLMDVWWNPTTEDQAIDRAHRIGQTRTVRVSRFTVKNTIEDRILALQDRKRQMVASAFGETELGEQRTRLTEQDLRYLFRV